MEEDDRDLKKDRCDGLRVSRIPDVSELARAAGGVDAFGGSLRKIPSRSREASESRSGSMNIECAPSGLDRR